MSACEIAFAGTFELGAVYLNGIRDITGVSWVESVFDSDIGPA